MMFSQGAKIKGLLHSLKLDMTVASVLPVNSFLKVHRAKKAIVFIVHVDKKKVQLLAPSTHLPEPIAYPPRNKE